MARTQYSPFIILTASDKHSGDDTLGPTLSYPKIIYKKDKEQYVNNFYNQML